MGLGLPVGGCNFKIFRGLFATFSSMVFLLRFSPYGGLFWACPPPLQKFLPVPMFQEEHLVPWNFKIIGLPKDNLKFSAQLLKQEIDLRGIPPATINIVCQ